MYIPKAGVFTTGETIAKMITVPHTSSQLGSNSVAPAQTGSRFHISHEIISSEFHTQMQIDDLMKALVTMEVG